MLENFSKKLKYYRNLKSLSLEDLSSKTGLSISYLSHLETGKRKNPSLDTLDKLATIFEIEIVDFLDL